TEGTDNTDGCVLGEGCAPFKCTDGTDGSSSGTGSVRWCAMVGDDVLRLRSDHTDSDSVDLHQRRLDGTDTCCPLPCLRPFAQPKNQKPPFKVPETPAAVGQLRS